MNRFWLGCCLIALATILYAVPVMAQEALQLDATYSSQSGAFSINYPTGWFAQGTEKNTVVTASIASSQAALKQTGISVAGEDVLIHVGTIMSSGSTLVANAAQPFLSSLSDKIRTKCKGKTSVEGRSAEQVEIKGKNFDSTSIYVQYGKGVFAFVTLFAAPDKLDQWRPTALAMAKSIHYQTAKTSSSPNAEPTSTSPQATVELPQLYTAPWLSDVSSSSFCYPAGWVIRNDSADDPFGSLPFAATIASDPSVLSKDLNNGDTFASGEVKIKLWVGLNRGFVGTHVNVDISIDKALTQCLADYCHVSNLKVGTVKLLRPTIARVELTGKGGEGMILVQDMGYEIYRAIYVNTAPAELAH